MVRLPPAVLVLLPGHRWTTARYAPPGGAGVRARHSSGVASRRPGRTVLLPRCYFPVLPRRRRALADRRVQLVSGEVHPVHRVLGGLKRMSC